MSRSSWPAVRPSSQARWARASTFASACASTTGTREAPSPSASARSSIGCGATGRYDVVFRLKENRWNGTVAPQLVVRRLFDAPEEYDELRRRLAALWRDGEQAWTPEARRVFAELELAAGSRRELYESDAFRALLEREALPRAA